MEEVKLRWGKPHNRRLTVSRVQAPQASRLGTTGGHRSMCQSHVGGASGALNRLPTGRQCCSCNMRRRHHRVRRELSASSFDLLSVQSRRANNTTVRKAHEDPRRVTAASLHDPSTGCYVASCTTHVGSVKWTQSRTSSRASLPLGCWAKSRSLQR